LVSESQDPEPQRNVVLYRGILAMSTPRLPAPKLTAAAGVR
jgi:hypothetical protein